MRIARLAALVIVVGFLGSCAKAPEAPAKPRADWPAFVSRFVEGSLAAHPSFAFRVTLGDDAGPAL